MVKPGVHTGQSACHENHRILGEPFREARVLHTRKKKDHSPTATSGHSFTHLCKQSARLIRKVTPEKEAHIWLGGAFLTCGEAT